MIDKSHVQLINFGNADYWDLDIINEIVSKVEAYAQKEELKNVTLITIENNTWNDKNNNRYDIVIGYQVDQKNDDTVIAKRFSQKLLYLKGEILDGTEFHKRFKEFYND